MVMCADVTRKQEWLCRQTPAENYCSPPHQYLSSLLLDDCHPSWWPPTAVWQLVGTSDKYVQSQISEYEESGKAPALVIIEGVSGSVGRAGALKSSLEGTTATSASLHSRWPPRDGVSMGEGEVNLAVTCHKAQVQITWYFIQELEGGQGSETATLCSTLLQVWVTEVSQRRSFRKNMWRPRQSLGRIWDGA